MVEREFIQGYGEKALELMPIVTPVRVDVLAGEVNEILDPDGRDLSKDTVDRINAWRTSFRTRYGLAVPGLSFTIAEGLEGEHKFRLVIMERLEEVAETNGRPLLQAILESVEAFCVANIAQFLGHQEAASLLRAANVPAASTIIEDPRMLTGFVVVLRVMLAGRVPITDIATIARSTRAAWRHPGGSGLGRACRAAELGAEGIATCRADAPVLTLVGAKDAEDAEMLLHDQEAMRARMFQLTGLVIPPITGQSRRDCRGWKVGAPAERGGHDVGRPR